MSWSLARSSSRAGLLVALAVALALAGAAPPAGAGDSSGGASRCHKGGWQHLYTEAGEPFRNQGHCTSHAARGGELRESPPPPPARTLTVVRAGTGSGTVSSGPAGIDCGADCSGSFPEGSTVTLTAAPAGGSTFAGWSGACSGTAPACEVVLSGDRDATATFVLEPRPSIRPPVVALGYADTWHDPAASSGGVPSPWAGDPGVVFLGCLRSAADCGQYDAGAVRLQHPAEETGPLTVDAAHVDIGACRFQPWIALLPATIGPGQSLVLTQSGLLGPPQPGPCDASQPEQTHDLHNFATAARPGDSLDPPHYDCDPAVRLTPVVTLRLSDGSTVTVTDTQRVLNTGGTHRFACTGVDHATPWTLVDAADVVVAP